MNYQILHAAKQPHLKPAKNVTLSSFFPAGTRFFYGYPAGADSGFLNRVPPAAEELVAARALCCAGKDVSVVAFGASCAPLISDQLIKILHLPQLAAPQLALLPSKINVDLRDTPRNDAIKVALKAMVRPGSFVMAQPFTDDDLASLYQIPPTVTAWFNDKHTMTDYIDAQWLPERYDSYASGADFAANYQHLRLPLVAKASSSSSGDGVYLCHTQNDIIKAAAELSTVNGTILVEQFVETQKNYGVHFGIPFQADKPAQLLGINEQLTTKDGEFIGGVIRATGVPTDVEPAVRYLLDTILPAVRAKGWYGIGGFDILVDHSGQQYFIDGNFRMTGMSAYHFLVANEGLITPIVSFSGEFTGSEADFTTQLAQYFDPKKPDCFGRIIALSHNGDTWRFNGAVQFETIEQQKQRAQTLLDHGVNSAALEQLADLPYSDEAVAATMTAGSF